MAGFSRPRVWLARRRMRRFWLLSLALAALTALSACTDTVGTGGPTATTEPRATSAAAQATATPAGQPLATPQGTPHAATPGETPTSAPFAPRVEVVASGLEVPWALAFTGTLPGADAQTPPGPYILVTERPGRLRLIANGELLAEPMATLNVVAVSESGLMGLALDPDFASNGHLYVMYTYLAETGNLISRLTVNGTRAGEEMVLLDGIPGNRNHDGGRLKFGPDGKLYATAGDAGEANLAQDPSSLAGKILRLNPDGSVPDDNPFPGSPVYSYGHRNPEGLAWHPESGALFSTEHGSSAHDEVNRIAPGANYGWPRVRGQENAEGMVAPVLESGEETWAPAGAAFYDGELLGPWQGNLFFGALRGQHLHRLVLAGPDQTQVVEEERLFEGEYGRIRAVEMGPDGALYFSTSNRDGRGSPAAEDDRILRLVS
jgi:glucose/arabinose dehydrogenase